MIKFPWKWHRFLLLLLDFLLHLLNCKAVLNLCPNQRAAAHLLGELLQLLLPFLHGQSSSREDVVGAGPVPRAFDKLPNDPFDDQADQLRFISAESLERQRTHGELLKILLSFCNCFIFSSAPKMEVGN